MNVINPVLTVLHTFQIVMGPAKGDLFKKYEASWGLVHKYPTIFKNSTTHILSDIVKHP